MTFIDILLLLLFITIMIVGFFKGMVKLVISIFAFYLAIIMSSLYYRFLAASLFEDTPIYIAQVVSFFLILFFAFLLLLAAGLYTFRYVRIPGKLAYIDKIFGMAFGVLLGIMVMGVISMLLRFLFIDQNTAGEITLPIVRGLQSSTRGSFMIPFIQNNIMPALYLTVDPILPQEAGLIFGIR
ncbi:MAG: colicin V production protein [Herpetosiphonaceae bacterium]|nr:MAG: colicin V production protein [Herpetosiphonaceae bacterium]